MQKVVVDSSVIVKWLNQENESLIEQSEKVLIDIQSGSISAIAPQLSRWEIGNALLKKRLDLEQAIEVLAFAYRLPVNFISETKTLAWETYKLAQDASITYYDAAFAALAKQANAILLTDNPKHQAKVKSVKVIPLKNYK